MNDPMVVDDVALGLICLLFCFLILITGLQSLGPPVFARLGEIQFSNRITLSHLTISFSAKCSNVTSSLKLVALKVVASIYGQATAPHGLGDLEPVSISHSLSATRRLTYLSTRYS